MSKSVLAKIKDVNKYPSVSVLLPTHRTSPDNKQDPIVLKNLIKEVERRLLEEFEERQVKTIMDQLHEVEASHDHEHNKDGLGIFVNEDLTEIARLPIPVEERVIIDPTFATRDLIRSMNQAEFYYILVLSKKEVSLFEAYRDQVHEVREHGFPIENTHDYLTNHAQLQNAEEVDEEVREFFNSIDKCFDEVYKGNPGELAVVGVERNLAFFHTVTDHKGLIIAEVAGNQEHATTHELGQLVWPEVLAALEAAKSNALDHLGAARGAKKAALGIREVWQTAQEGRGEMILVENSYMQPAIVDGQQINLDVAVDDPLSNDDIVDDVIEIVLSMKGKVVFMEDGTLGEYERIAMTLRW